MDKEKRFILSADIDDNIYYAYYLIGDWETIKSTYDNLKNDISQRQCDIEEIKNGFFAVKHGTTYKVVIEELEHDPSNEIITMLNCCRF